ncbi:MAG: ParB N-terminal domain-containing protein, partial [Proteobacteria bacterium]|nr:ParB N-terminal domain-containing protein [Pseudomonadota bacterium]
MAKTACTVPITQIILDEEIYPRSGVYPKRVSMFAENMRDGFEIDPIEVQIHPDYIDKYRILDGAHRWHAYKEVGATEIPVHIITLDGLDPLLYAAKKAIGPLQLTEDEARTTARRAYENNPCLTSFEIGQAIGRSRQAVDSYIADLRAATNMEIDIKIFRMHRLGIPQERIAARLGIVQASIHNRLSEMPGLANLINADLSKGFTVPQVAEKHACPVGPEDRTGGWAEPLVWSIALEEKDDLDRF